LWCYFSIHFLHWRVDERLSGINWRNWKVILNNLSIYKKLTFLCSLAMVDFYLIRMSNVRETFSFILDSCQRCFTCFMVWTNIPLVLVESFPKSRGSNYICEVGKHITQILLSHSFMKKTYFDLERSNYYIAFLIPYWRVIEALMEQMCLDYLPLMVIRDVNNPILKEQLMSFLSFSYKRL
jgi:hypothetical protein